ncbi:MAG: HTH-type transcriptional activator RhaR [Candidatus Ordinivivax streblomastigis]|uniref:HTH-type transcriptional activator RhaR n=1 Tax=Candidatus Ordinivivax streblomastigis TaxID=2540710 RepID=A0A5M8NV55_9BACT|nr:MAG: HTH-type transcriptional activator RhaR [Candidatus Ordinivivax streblomastigis]
MNKIPTHKIHEWSATGIMLEYFRGDIAQDERQLLTLKEAHRDNYYIFFLQECGESCLLIDCKECRMRNAMFGYILPGQIHFGIEWNNVSGWFLCLDALFVKDELKEIFEKALIPGNLIVPDTQALNDLRYGFELSYRKIQSGHWSLAQHAVTLLTGIIAELYQHYQPAFYNKRAATLTRQFKLLLSDNLNSTKSPSQYAIMLHVSIHYLNKAVKSITNFTAGYWIQTEIILEAKRLLFYTDKSIKEIAFELGYEDYSYFTRRFTKIAGVSPLQFRKNYFK